MDCTGSGCVAVASSVAPWRRRFRPRRRGRPCPRRRVAFGGRLGRNAGGRRQGGRWPGLGSPRALRCPARARGACTAASATPDAPGLPDSPSPASGPPPPALRPLTLAVGAGRMRMDMAPQPRSLTLSSRTLPGLHWATAPQDYRYARARHDRRNGRGTARAAAFGSPTTGKRAAVPTPAFRTEFRATRAVVRRCRRGREAARCRGEFDLSDAHLSQLARLTDHLALRDYTPARHVPSARERCVVGRGHPAAGVGRDAAAQPAPQVRV